MPKLLVINSSPRGERSHSRNFVNKFVQQWAPHHPDFTVEERDLGHDPVPHVTEDWVVGAFAPSEYQTPESRAAIATSDFLVDEFLAADRLVIGVPMYNLNIPSTLKAYIDQIIRVNRTFGVGPEGYFGLVKDKKILFVTASGGAFRAGTPAEGYNFQEPYLRAIFGFIGVTDVQFIVVDNQNQGQEAITASQAEAEAAVAQLAKQW